MALVSSWRYQVFLSFSGEDTRKTFIGHLYDKLTTKGIYTFRDDRELPRGKFISQELRETIRDSRISIVVISENYAFSSWCLGELEEIIKCNHDEKMRQIVIPIFYKVDPSDVSKISNRFAEAFKEHEENFRGEKEKVEAWKEALAKLGSISGWHLQDGDEASFIGQVVADILSKVSCLSSIDASGLVGMDTHVREMKQLLRVDSNVVRMVGIWGQGGIGKTTIARVVYDKLCTRFDASWFLEDVAFKFKKNGGGAAAALKEELLSNILKERDLKGWPLDKHSTVIKDKLGKRNVLIVLDNVDHLEQLEVLAKSVDWFGDGSRIIITTRDKGVLEKHGVKFIYDTKNLDNEEALQLFSQCAFKQNQPKSDYAEMSHDFVTYAKGLPSALKVLGSSLYNRILRQWQEELDTLRELSNPELYNLLRISYDGLKDNEKEVFLDIACFFNGEDKDRVRDIFDACKFCPDSAFEVLSNKALLNTVNNKLYIDGLLRDMALKIVLQESEEHGERSRLWDPEHIYWVLSACKGTGRVKGIFLEMAMSSESKDMRLRRKSFKGMPNLRLLKMNNPSCNFQLLNARFASLSGRLRYLHWYGYPSRSWGESSAQYLVELYLPHGNVENLWAGKQYLPYLKLIDLNHSKLINLPDLSEAKKLKHLNLQGCTNLVEILSLQFLTELEFVDLSYCSNLKHLSELPRSIKYLYLTETALEELPESLGFLSGCEELIIRKCTRLRKLPGSFVKLISATSIDIAGCPHLLELLSNKCSSSDLTYVVHSFSLHSAKGHRELEATAAPLGRDKRNHRLGPEVELCDFDGPTFVNAVRTNSDLEVDTKSAPESTTAETFFRAPRISRLRQTKTQPLKGVNETSNMQDFLRIKSCVEKYRLLVKPNDLLWDACPSRSLSLNFRTEILLVLNLTHYNDAQLWMGKQDLVSLKQVDLSYSSLIMLPDLSKASNLWSLNLQGCINLVEVSSVQSLINLEYLNLNGCTSLRSLPSMMALKLLSSLHLSGCSKIRRLPLSIGWLSGLIVLDIRNCKRLENLPIGTSGLKSIQNLHISGCSKLMKHLSGSGIEETPQSVMVSSLFMSESITNPGC